MSYQTSFIRTLSIIAVVVIIMAACGRQVSDAERISRATEQITSGYYQTAIIELKKVLQNNNSNTRARILLGQCYLVLGDGVAAEKELRKAVLLGINHTEVIVHLGRALILQHKYNDALNEIQMDHLSNGTDKAILLSLRGEAYLGLKQNDQAENAFQGAKHLDPHSVAPLIGLARVALQRGELNDAESFLNEAMRLTAVDPESWIVMGLLHQRKGHYIEAEKAFTYALQVEHAKGISERKFRAKIGLITSLIVQGKLDIASQNVVEIREAVPRHPYPQYLNAWLVYQNQNYELANNLLLELQKQMPEHIPSLFLLGASNYALGNYEQANLYLTRFVNAIPTHIHGRKLLGATRLKLRRPDLAMEVLQPVSEEDEADANLLLMAGQAAASLGKTEMQLHFLQKAAQASPMEVSIRAELARVYMKEGAFREAISELESIQHSNDLEHRQTDMLLIYARLRTGDFVAAKELVKKMIKRTPDDPGVYTLRGSIELLAGDRLTAERYFQNALTIDANFIPAKLSLARMNLEDGDLAEASQRFDQILLTDKNAVAAMLGHAQIAEQRGDQEQALAWVERARAADTNAITPRIVLAQYYLNTDKPNIALTIANELNALKPNDPYSSLLLGRAQRAVGQTEDSIKTLETIVNQYPQIIPAYLELANSYIFSKEHLKARNILKEALKLNSNSLQIKVAQVRLELLTENYNIALKLAEKIQQQYKDSDAGFSLAGDIQFRQKRFRQAQRAYQKAITIRQTAELTIKLARAYNAEAKTRQATRVLEDGLENNPNDTAIRTALAENYQKLGKNSLAENHYQYLLKQQPENAVVLNNLAIIYTKKDAALALSYARQAFQSAPQNAAIADTLGWLLVENGKVAEGVRLLQRAVAQGSEPTITYHLAVALARSGKPTEARAILIELLDSEEEFKERKQARKLLDDLN